LTLISDFLQASIAKLETSLSMYGDKLELKVYGFNEKIPALLSKILAIAKSFMPNLERFKVIKENMERGFRNTNMKPLNHSTYLRLQLLCKRIYDSDEKLSVLNDLSLDDLNSFIPELRSQIFIEALCHGNLSEDEAVNISNIFKDSLTVEPLPSKCRHGEQITCFPMGAKLVRDVNVKNKSETNSVVELYYQIEPEEAQSTRTKAVLDLFHEIIEEPLFNQLRTKEQLGYVVECGPRLTYRVHGFCFCVQSSKYGPVHLLGRVDNFIKDIEGLLEQLDDESYEDYRSGMIARLLEKDPSLLSETNDLWSQIVDKR
jgi:nardilysin